MPRSTSKATRVPTTDKPTGATGTATGVGGADLSSLLDLGETFNDAPVARLMEFWRRNDKTPAVTSISRSTRSTTTTDGQRAPAASFTYNGLRHTACAAKRYRILWISQSLTVNYQLATRTLARPRQRPKTGDRQLQRQPGSKIFTTEG